MKQVLRDITPPALWRAASRLHRTVLGSSPSDQSGGNRSSAKGVEQPAEYYDRTFANRDHWKQHYTKSHYYPLWTVVADRIRHLGANRILDIGCGPGQVACLLRDIGVEDYKGLDFSSARVEGARRVCPQFEFRCADVFTDDLLETYDYDCVLTMEFLEHVERELDVLNRVRSGTTVVATVPNFGDAAHVRHFDDVGQVQERYGPVFRELDVTPILANERGITYYLMQGTR